MSGVNLHEFNKLSKQHKYFMTNNRKNGFPSLKENSSFFKKILQNKTRNLSHKIIDFSAIKPKKSVRFINNDESLPYRSINQYPSFTDKRSPNISNEYNNIQRYNNTNIELNNKNKMIPYYKINNNNVNNDNESNNTNNTYYYKIPIKLRYNISTSPEIYRQCTNVYSTSNINDSEGEKSVLNFKGKKLFYVNSFSATKNDSTFYSPDKNMNKSRAESELFRNSEELKKKKEEIYFRKIKRESSRLKREMLRKEKDKEIKNEKVDIDINTINNEIKNKRKINRFINKNKMKIINLSNNNEVNNNFIKINNRYKSIDIYVNSNSIKSINANQNPINNINTPTTIKRVYKYKINKAKLNELTNGNSNANKDNNKIINTLYKNSNKFPPKIEKKLFNNVYITQSTDYTPQNKNKNSVNYKIRENLNELRKSNKALLENNANEQKLYNNISSDKHNYPYNFVSKKRFIEDYSSETPIIYSKDKKVSIRLHTLHHLNERFLGKKPTKEKLKFQRIINLYFDKNSKGNQRNFKNKRKYKILSSIKEEKEKSKAEPISKLNKVEQKMERKEKPTFQRNIRMKYLCHNNK